MKMIVPSKMADGSCGEEAEHAPCSVFESIRIKRTATLALRDVFFVFVFIKDEDPL